MARSIRSSSFCEHKQHFSIPGAVHRNAVGLEVPGPGGIQGLGELTARWMFGLCPSTSHYRSPKSTSVILRPCKSEVWQEDAVLARSWTAKGQAGGFGGICSPSGWTDPGQRQEVLDRLKLNTEHELEGKR